MKRLLTIISVILFAAAGFAQRPMTLEECIDSALSRNPALNAAALDVERARLMKGTAFDPPFTGITLKQETTGGGGPENGVMFSQEFDFPTVYTARGRQLDALYNLEQNRFRIEAAAVAGQVREVYQAALYRVTLLRLSDDLGRQYEHFLQLAQTRFKEGETGRLEVMNAERVYEKNQLERQVLHTELATEIAALKRLICCTEEIMIADTVQTLIPYAPTDFDFSTSLRGEEAAGQIAVADREIALAKNQFLPGISLGATVQALIKSFNPYHIERERFRQGNFMGFEVGITVPLFFGAQNSRLKAANAEREAARLRYEYAGMEAENELNALHTTLGSINDRLTYLTETAIPRADEIRRIAEVSYGFGEIDYMEYINNIETAFAVYREYADTVNEYNRTVIKIKDLTAKR